MTVKLLTEQHLVFVSLNGGYTGSSEYTLVKCHIVGNHMSRLKLSAANNVDLDTTVSLWSTLFVCMPKLVLGVSIYLQQSTCI